MHAFNVTHKRSRLRSPETRTRRDWTSPSALSPKGTLRAAETALLQAGQCASIGSRPPRGHRQLPSRTKGVGGHWRKRTQPPDSDESRITTDKGSCSLPASTRADSDMRCARAAAYDMIQWGCVSATPVECTSPQAAAIRRGAGQR
ncbi:hypothetical protein HD597_009648 [Nonomuraea thailandensis]|uniref:Uncharacterized protein n=1 Tax=Nonomuraea thailandensis TaxID=1188745 RepID=A0A9X2GXD1_9ACTN|nr:hypothetical protein [Nonomuraea thailandensis]